MPISPYSKYFINELIGVNLMHFFGMRGLFTHDYKYFLTFDQLYAFPRLISFLGTPIKFQKGKVGGYKW